MTIPIGEVVKTIGEVSELVGMDLLPLFQDRLPPLKRTPLPVADVTMHETRDAALKRLEAAKTIARKRREPQDANAKREEPIARPPAPPSSEESIPPAPPAPPSSEESIPPAPPTPRSL